MIGSSIIRERNRDRGDRDKEEEKSVWWRGGRGNGANGRGIGGCTDALWQQHESRNLGAQSSRKIGGSCRDGNQAEIKQRRMAGLTVGHEARHVTVLSDLSQPHLTRAS
ncbi:hypothetical protein PoB_000378100 [Plakobranchus ocellatus]|uniref:Uncharacterized protein n=1 Tax=Plakobranchus ocellatus TaxID=259542 RepID=A0AAV3Y4G5_9GAST|nr:hypothetical protein PoB_000378100 [Plakobranchus ocellatus]